MRRSLNCEGYKYLQARRKGMMSKQDIKKRLDFAKHTLKHYDIEVLWKETICFYLDGTSWTFKTNPCDQAHHVGTRVWRKKNEGLSFGCTTKGKKVGYGDKLAHFIVCISYGKGVIACEQYEKMCGPYFASFIKEHLKNSKFQS